MLTEIDSRSPFFIRADGLRKIDSAHSPDLSVTLRRRFHGLLNWMNRKRHHCTSVDKGGVIGDHWGGGKGGPPSVRVRPGHLLTNKRVHHDGCEVDLEEIVRIMNYD
jgi:hypothetical protein